MPISSGANGWPNAYFNKAPPRSNGPKTVFVDRGEAPGSVNYEDHYYHGARNPSSVTDYYYRGPQGYGRYGPDGRMVHGADGKLTRHNPAEHPRPGRGICCHCGGDDMFTTGLSGAGAGCCLGGMFGSRSYPYSPEHNYSMKGTGRRRCCACILGMLLGLLLLGLILGLLLGLKPYLEGVETRRGIQRLLAGGYYENGVYYWPITDPPDVYYLALGPGIPCNPYNNNSDAPAPTVGFELVTVDPSTSDVPFTVEITQQPAVTLPDCQDITTSFVLAQNYVTTTTTPVVVTTLSTASHVTPHCSLLLVWLVASLIARHFLN